MSSIQQPDLQMTKILTNHIFPCNHPFNLLDFRVDYVVPAYERIEVEMDALGNVSIMTLFPAILLLLTTEIVFSSYKASSPKWTTRLAYSNLIINLAWIIIIIVLLLNPILVTPYLANVLANIFQRAPEEIMTQVHLIVLGIGLMSIATTIIDSVAGFRNLKCNSTDVNKASHD